MKICTLLIINYCNNLNNLGGMRKAYLVDIPNMIDDLKLEVNQTKFVVKCYKNVYRNKYENISMDAQMQTICKTVLEKLNVKLKNANLNKLAIYRYLLF